MSDIITSTYEIESKIGSGGGGNVYLARHLRLNKKVVLKEDKRKITVRPELLRREVDVLKDLSHSYIPQVYDFFVENEKVYTVMEFIEGESLDNPLKRKERFSQPQVIKWAKQILEALCYLHSPTHGQPPHGYVHSDIKPANLMRTKYNDVCLIDFNIALAIGEENVVGLSPGYASPEHYGYDYSSGNKTMTIDMDDQTMTMENETQTESLAVRTSTKKEKIVIPDERSDIYSLGATLYHLLSGQRPDKDAKKVVSLSEKEFSPQIVKIIAKAMMPNPDLRYQTAEEMLQAFENLRKNDARVKRFRRRCIFAGVYVAVTLLFGVFCMLTGLKRMQVTENWLKLSEYAKSALAKGDRVSAMQYALQGLPQKTGLFLPKPIPEAQSALTYALGVYDLSDGYKAYKTVELPEEPLYMAIAADGKKAACIYTGFVAVFDTDTANIIATLAAEPSALSEVVWLNEHTILYAGKDGIRAYDTLSGKDLWSGKPATAVCVSQDKTTAAALYKEETFATVYDTSNGQVVREVDFGGKSQKITINDKFANPNENIFELNADGSLLSVSFSDGALKIFNLKADGELTLLEEGSGYTHFEGGFYKQYFAFSATNTNHSLVAVIDSENKKQMGGFEADSYCGVQTDEHGIYVQSGNILVKMDPVSGEQTPLVVTTNNIARFSVSQEHTLIASDDGISFFGKNAVLITELKKNSGSDFIQIAKGTALVGSLDSPTVCIMRYENHSDAAVFAYDSTYKHDEARISADEKTVMLFSYKQFRVYDIDGEIIDEVDIPRSEKVYDQQFIREGADSFLEVTYEDGTIQTYSAKDGSLVDEQSKDKPDMSLNEEYETEHLRFEVPLHGTPTVYDKASGKQVAKLKEDAYLTYVNQIGEYIVEQYVTAEGEIYGVLQNEKCETLAVLPKLCDIVDGELIFDYPTGNLRRTKIYDLKQLVKMADEELSDR